MENSIYDPADDGMEITIIRAVTGRPETFYQRSIRLSRIARHIEETHTFEIEREFCRKVGMDA